MIGIIGAMDTEVDNIKAQVKGIEEMKKLLQCKV